MRKIGSSLMRLIFLFPVILLSFFVWRDYSGEIKDINDNPPALAGLYYLDGGNKIATLSQGEDWDLVLQIMDTKSGQLLKKETIPSNVHKQAVAAYQQDKLVVSTYDDEQKLQVNVIDHNGDMTSLTKGELTIPTFLSSDLKVWRDRLFFSGNTVNDEMYLAQIREGKLEKIILDKGELLPAKIERIRYINGIQDQGVMIPVFELSLMNDGTAYISGILNDKQQPAVTLKKDNENTFVGQDRAVLEFAKSFKLNMTKQIRVFVDFPSQPHFYNPLTEERGGIVPTPKPVYHVVVHTLNQDEVLIVGSSEKDNKAGSRLGYIVNQQTGEYTDVTPLVAPITYEDLDQAKVSFFKDVNSASIYYVNQGQSAGILNVDTKMTERITEPEAQKWANMNVSSVSLESFLLYLSSWNALVINWIVWVALSLFFILSALILPNALRKSHSKKLARGVLCHGTIMNMKETGLYVNERPQVRFTVQFEDEGQLKQVEIKQVVSFLNAGSIGDSVVISYDRKRKSAMFVNEGDVSASQQEQMEQIDHAVLEYIEKFGAIGRGRALLLHFKAGGKQYRVPVVQPLGFDYRVGEQASLLIVNGTTRIRSYGRASHRLDTELVQLDGKIVEIDKYSISIDNRQLMMLDIVIDEPVGRLRKTNSLFVPAGMPVKEGVMLPVSFRKEDYRKEIRLLKAKQGAAKVVDVQYSGTLGERPLAHITIDRAGTMYSIEQTIEPVYGIAVGDEIWIAYDEASREAIIIKYATNS